MIIARILNAEASGESPLVAEPDTDCVSYLRAPLQATHQG